MYMGSSLNQIGSRTAGRVGARTTVGYSLGVIEDTRAHRVYLGYRPPLKGS